MHLKKIIVAVALLGVFIGSIIVYNIYTSIFSPNTTFNNKSAFVFIPTGASFNEVKDLLSPLVADLESFESVANKKGYTTNIKPGKYAIKKGMNNNDIVNTLRSQNLPIIVSFNNQESLDKLAGRIALQIEADSVSLLKAFNDLSFLKNNGFTDDTKLSFYIPNSYEFFWNTSAEKFRDRMLKEYNKFWDESRQQKAKNVNLSKVEVITLASVVQKETAKVNERPRVAGVYLNRLKKNILLQADPTVIYAIKKGTGNYDTIIKRVLYKDLEFDSPYNTYKYAGLPPGPIAMPDITSIDAVLNAESHEYYYFVADLKNFGYHKFAKTLNQHNQNAREYQKWMNSQNINR